MVNKRLIGILVIMLVIVSIGVVASFHSANQAIKIPINQVINSKYIQNDFDFIPITSACPDIQKLQVCNEQIKICFQQTIVRKDVCESVKTTRTTLCNLKDGTDANGLRDPSKDLCEGTPGKCPDMTLYDYYADSYMLDSNSFGRKLACESTKVNGVNCIYDGGGNDESAVDDICSLDIDDDGILNNKDKCSDTLPDVTVQEVGPKIGCPMGDFNGDGSVNGEDVTDIRKNIGTLNDFWNQYVQKDPVKLHAFVKALVQSINIGEN